MSNLLGKNWLEEAKKRALRVRNSTSEKNPLLDLRKLGGTPDDPEVIVVEFLSEPKEVQTQNMSAPMQVCDIKVLQSNNELAKVGEKYSIWANTTSLRDEFKKVKVGETFVIASYGKVRTKRGTPFYVFSFIEEA